MSVEIVAPAITRPMLVLLGGGLALWESHEVWRGWSARRWPSVLGRLVEAGARYRPGRRGGYAPAVRYEYSVGAEALTGERLSYGSVPLHHSAAGAERVLSGMVPGADVPVFHHPRRPDRAVLRPGFTVADLVLLAVGVLLCAVGVRG